MSRFYNYSHRRSTRRTSSRPYVKHNPDYIADMQRQLYELLDKAKTDQEREALIKAYEITINPRR